MLKTTKRYVITTNAVNSYGFRMLSEGIDWGDYNNNPIMLYMHFRPTGKDKNEVRAMGNVRDIRTDENGVTTGQPYFNDKYDFAREIYEGYENGTYNMLSLCALPLEYSSAQEDLLPDSIYPTVKRSKAKEISCVDIGSNSEAFCVELCDESGSIIKLSDNNQLIHIKQDNMKLITLNADTASLLQLSDTATPAEVHTAINGLIQLADNRLVQINALSGEKTKLEGEKEELQTKYNKEIKLAAETKVNTLVEGAITARKITAEQKENWIKLAAGDFESTKSLLDSMKPSPTVNSLLAPEEQAKQDPDYVKLSYDELDKKGKLIKLKADNFELFKEKYEENFEKPYAGSAPQGV